MIKIIDIDKLFDEYISDYVYSNVGKVKPEEIEDKIPVLYLEFGKKNLKQLDGKSPEEYYLQFTVEERVNCLKQHLVKGVSVSDFLCESIVNADSEDCLIKALDDEENEEFTVYIMNMLNEKSSEKAVKKYLSFLICDYGETVKELATDLLKVYADKVKDDIVSAFYEVSVSTKEYFTEILSYASKSDKVFPILIDEFINHPENVGLYAGYLAKYGDENAIPYLKTLAENEKTNYADFEELRFAIETLGGECDVKRDFSNDKYFKKIKGN